MNGFHVHTNMFFFDLFFTDFNECISTFYDKTSTFWQLEQYLELNSVEKHHANIDHVKTLTKIRKKTPEICTLIAFAIFRLSILTSFRILLFCSLSKILLWYPYVYNLLLNYNRVTIKSHKQASIMKIASYLIKTRDIKIIFI